MNFTDPMQQDDPTQAILFGEPMQKPLGPVGGGTPAPEAMAPKPPDTQGEPLSGGRSPKMNDFGVSPPPEMNPTRFHDEMSQRNKDIEAEIGHAQGRMTSARPDPSNPGAYLDTLGDHLAHLHQLKAEKAEFMKENPWGSEGNHPGLGGKIGHIFSGIGQTALNAVAPGVTQAIPGTQANLNHTIAQGEKAAQTEVDQAEKNAQTGNLQSEAVSRNQSLPSNIAHTGAETAHLNQETQDLANAPTPLPAQYAESVEQHNPTEQSRVADAITGIQPQKPASEKTPPHITALGPDGKSHIMERDPATGEYSIDRGIAPPNFAQVAPSIRTVDVLNDQGIPTIKTLAGREVGQAATGAYGHEEAQAGAVTRAGTKLIQHLQTPEAQKILGHLDSYVKKGTLGTPLADQQAAKLNAELKTFAALQPTMHGFRARSAQEAFEKMVGGLAQDPKATIGAIQGILDTAGNINPNMQQGGAFPPSGNSGAGKKWNPVKGRYE